MSIVAPDALDEGRRRRVAVGAAVIASALGVDLLLQSAFGAPHRATPARLVIFAVHFVTVLAVCIAASEWCQRRGYGPVGRLARTVLAAGTASALLALLAFALFPEAPRLGLPPPHVDIPAARNAAFGFARGVIICGLWALGFVYPLAVESEQLRSANELARLRSHLEPHFLLNTLNMIAGLVVEEPGEARRLIGCLGDLLRDAVDDRGDSHTVDEEVRWLRRYAEILEARHRGAISFHWEVTEGARRQRIPRLLLQPLVENAAKHGALRRPGGAGNVTVRAAVDEERGRLVCVVADDGEGPGTRPVRAGAFGLRSVQRRLALGHVGATFRVDASPTGTRATVEIPLPKGWRRP